MSRLIALTVISLIVISYVDCDTKSLHYGNRRRVNIGSMFRRLATNVIKKQQDQPSTPAPRIKLSMDILANDDGIFDRAVELEWHHYKVINNWYMFSRECPLLRPEIGHIFSGQIQQKLQRRTS